MSGKTTQASQQYQKDAPRPDEGKGAYDRRKSPEERLEDEGWV
ncbi:hypothetical protein [Prosthecobacter algae]